MVKINKIIYVLIILILFLNQASAVNITEKTANCVAIMDYEEITTLVGSISLMLLGFVIIINSLRVANPTFILIGITTEIIGFGSLLLGNYIFSAIHATLC